jgi:hypothetical protein
MHRWRMGADGMMRARHQNARAHDASLRIYSRLLRIALSSWRSVVLEASKVVSIVDEVFEACKTVERQRLMVEWRLLASAGRRAREETARVSDQAAALELRLIRGERAVRGRMGRMMKQWERRTFEAWLSEVCRGRRMQAILSRSCRSLVSVMVRAWGDHSAACTRFRAAYLQLYERKERRDLHAALRMWHEEASGWRKMAIHAERMKERWARLSLRRAMGAWGQSVMLAAVIHGASRLSFKARASVGQAGVLAFRLWCIAARYRLEGSDSDGDDEDDEDDEEVFTTPIGTPSKQLLGWDSVTKSMYGLAVPQQQQQQQQQLTRTWVREQTRTPKKDAGSEPPSVEASVCIEVARGLPGALIRGRWGDVCQRSQSRAWTTCAVTMWRTATRVSVYHR